MNLTNQEKSKQYQYVQNEVASIWGYDLNSNFLQRQDKKFEQRSSPIVANITLRKFTKQIPKSDKIKKIQDEIRVLQNERQLMKMNQQAAKNNYQDQMTGQQSSIVKMMETKIQQYNYIIAHHHITSKNSEAGKNIFANAIKSETQKILDKIEEYQKQLFNADMKNQITINRKIARLYRQYRQQYSIQDRSVEFPRSKSVLAQPAKSARENKNKKMFKLEDRTMINLSKLSSIKMSNSNSGQALIQNNKKSMSLLQGEMKDDIVNKFKQQQFKDYQKSRRKQSNPSSQINKMDNYNHINKQGSANSLRQSDKQKFKRYINQPFLEKKEIESFKTLQKNIKSNHLALHLWKTKVEDAYENSETTQQLQQFEKKRDSEKEKEDNGIVQRESQLKTILDKNIHLLNIGSVIPRPYFKQINNHHQQKNEQQQQIFSELLRKKNNKFNRMCGTKILVKYNSKEKAKSMLKGQTDKPRNSRIEMLNQKKGLSESSQQKKQTNKILIQAKDGQQFDELKWLGEEIDEDHYWRMCKNQKINLLLKKQ